MTDRCISSRTALAAAIGVAALIAPLLPAAISPTADVAAQAVTFEETVRGLASQDTKVRRRAVQTLKAAAYPEAAVPLAEAVADADDDVQLEAIAAELNIFLANKVTPRKRVGFIVEVRGNISAEPLFTAGPAVFGPRRVPAQVPLALANAAVDSNPRVAGEALYAFGALAGEVNGIDRAAVLTAAAPLLAGMMGAPDPAVRIGALRVVGRVYARRPGDAGIQDTIGDAVIGALNDRETPVRETAMWALGSMRYERSVQALGELFRFYRKGPLAERALDALARIGHEASLPQFVEQMHGGNPTFRLIAIEGIARSGDRTRAEEIQTLIRAQRNEATLLAGHFANVLLSDGPVDPIVELMKRPRLRDQAFQYVVELAFGRTAAFGRHLQDPDDEVRLGLLDALGLAGDPAAVAMIEPFAQDTNAEVALAAQRAVARLRVASRL